MIMSSAVAEVDRAVRTILESSSKHQYGDHYPESACQSLFEGKAIEARLRKYMKYDKCHGKW